MATITGTSGNDTLPGTIDDDSIRGLAGNDTLDGGNGNDTVLGGTGDDRFLWEYGADSLDGGGGTDTLVVDGYRDISDDTITGIERVEMSYNATLLAQTGQLALFATFDEVSGYDYYFQLASGGSVTFASGAFIQPTRTIHLYGSGGNEVLTFAAGTTNPIEFYGYDGDDRLDAGLGADSLSGGNGNDTLTGGGGNDSLDGSYDDDSVDGGDGDDTLTGYYGNDTVVGGAGNDRFLWEYGADSLDGGGGTDTLVVDGYRDISDDTITGIERVEMSYNATLLAQTGQLALFATFDEVSGYDYYFQLASGGSVTFASGAFTQPTRTIHIYGSGSNDVLTFASGTTNPIEFYGYDGNDRITGRSGDDTFDGGYGNDSLAGGGGNNTLTGYEGNDTLTAGGGNDSLDGGSGDDSVNSGDGDNTLTGYFGNDTVVGGAGNDRFEWEDGADSLSGGDGTDTLVVSSYRDISDDTITGIERAEMSYNGTLGAQTGQLAQFSTFDEVSGYDYYFALTSGGSVTFANGAFTQPTRTIYVTGSPGNDILTFAAGITNPIYFYDYTGGDDRIDGGVGNDTFYSGNGNDTLSGGVGNDSLDGSYDDDSVDGGDDNDTLTGFDGNDTVVGGAGDDRFLRENGADSLDGGSGTDTLVVDGYWDISDDTVTGIERVELTYNATLRAHPGQLAQFTAFDEASGYDYYLALASGGTAAIAGAFTQSTRTIHVSGSEDADALTFNPGLSNPIDFYGYNGEDRIGSGAGADTLNGGYGNDSLTANAGADVLYGEYGDDTLDSGSQNDTLDGGEGNDSLLGRSGDDDLQGGGGDDTLIAGAGNDGVLGGYGNDSLNGLAGNDTVDGEIGDDSIDGGSNNDLLSGDDGNDTIFGDQGNDTIDAGTGDDKIISGDDNDLVYGGTGNDTVDSNPGNDTVYGESGDDLVRAGAGRDSLIGGEGADLLSGDDGTDTLDGGLGNDTLRGGLGNDSLVGGSGDADTFDFNDVAESPQNPAGRDTIDGVDGIGVAGGDRIDLFGIDAIDGTPSNDAFTFIGTAAFTALGQLRVTNVGADTLIQANTSAANGNSADFSILVIDGATDASQWTAGDFLL